MNIINKTRLIHLGNTSLFTKETTLSPKFWAKCATVVSSLAMMEDASAGSRTIEVTSTDVAIIDTKFSGSNNFVKSGTGTLVLNYENATVHAELGENLSAAFTGQTSVTGGTLALQKAGALGSGGTLTMAASTTLQAYASITVPNAIVLGGNSIIATTGNSLNNTLTLSGGITESGSRILTVSGDGTLVLNNTSAHTGGTTLGGTSKLKITHANAIPAAGALTLGGGTTLQDSTSASINALTLSGNATVTVDAGQTLTATGAVTGMHTLTKTGHPTGILLLSGTNSSGSTNLTISAGTVSVGADANIPGGALTLAGGKLHASITYASSKNFTMANHSEIGSSGVLTYSGTITDAGSAKTLTISEGTVALNADYSGNTHTDLTVASGATLRIDAANNLTGGALTLSGTLKTITNSFATGKNIAVSTAGILDVDNTTTLTASGVISGAATLTKSGGTGTLVLTGANSASATTNLTITTGVVSVGLDANIPGGTLSLNGGTLLTGPISSGKALTMVLDSSIGSSGQLDYSGSITDAGSPKTLTVSEGTVALSGTYSSNMNTNLKVNSGAALSIGEANNLTGGSLTLDGGTLKHATRHFLER